MSKSSLPNYYWKFFGLLLKYGHHSFSVDFSGPVEYGLSSFAKLDWKEFVFKSEHYSDISMWWKSNFLSNSSLKFLADFIQQHPHEFTTKLDFYRYCDIVLIILRNIKGIDLDS